MSRRLDVLRVCFLLWCITINSIYGEDLAAVSALQVQSSGVVTYGQQTLDNLEATGVVFLDKTEVLGSLELYGNLNAKGASIGSINVHGAAILTDCTIKGDTEIFGTLIGEGNKFLGSIKVDGGVNISRSSIQGESTINGGLRAQKTQFQAQLSIASDKIYLDECSLTSILIRQTDSEPQVLELAGGTVVEGKVTFESKKGVIILEKGSKIKGAISGITKVQQK